MLRRLAAILFADVAGYTRLMDQFEAETHPRLMTVYDDIVAPAIVAAQGQVVKNTGDGFLARFESVNAAFQCATRIQQEVDSRESVEPDEKRIAFRMGLHVGDIVVEDRDVYGAGVNLAARLQELAEPGSVAISASVREQLGGNLTLPTVDLGNVSLKNIAGRVRAFRVELVPQAGRPPPVAGAPWQSRPSIAVLPFAEYGMQPGESFIGDGIAEDVISALASLPDLFVISRNSTLKYRDSRPNIQVVGRELGVRYVCSGAVRHSNNRLRISAELADVESLTVIATDRFEGDTADLFALQDRLTERVVQTIAPHIRDAELRRIRSKRTDSLDAYEYMLRGLDLLYRLDQDEFEQARRMFELSISLDENYAAPRAFTALWYSLRLNQGWSTDREADRAKVAEFCASALRCDPNDVYALALSGHLRALLFRDFDTAFELFDRALRASPNSAFAWSRSSAAFSYIGNGAEGRRRAEEALRLSPLDPHLFFTHGVLALGAYTEGDHEAAILWGRKSYAENPKHTPCLRFLAASLAAVGRIAEAREMGVALMQLEPGFRVKKFCDGYAYQDERFRQLMASQLLLADLPE